jgi:alpha-glucosidase (family GH31 glycosyl hydrolase)
MTGPWTRRALLRGLAVAAPQVLLAHRWTRAMECGAAGGGAAPASGPAAVDLTVAALNRDTLRISLAAADVCLSETDADGSLVQEAWPPALLQRDTRGLAASVPWGKRRIRVEGNPLTLTVDKPNGRVAQQLRLEEGSERVSFSYRDGPVFGLGEGLQSYDLRGTRDDMRNGQHGDTLHVYGARLPIPWVMGPEGWGLFFHQPWGTFDLTGAEGVFRPVESARGLDIFLLLGETPAGVMQQWAELTGYPHLPPIWSFGYQQSHRTLASREEVLEEARTFREKKLPCDALIYLGTGFCPSGWNTGHGSFAFNQGVFPDPAAMLGELHDEHFKVVLHVVNPPEDLHGKVTDSGQAAREPGDAAAYWANHVPFERMGIDGWWPDEGDTLPVASRLARNRMYWEGGRMSRPDFRPYTLNRNGYAGLQRYGWLWSGDVFSTWKTLAAQVMVGINVGLCGIPYWGTDTGGFVPTEELRADLFLRWFQFSAFCPLFRGHGRTWKLRLPWTWNSGDYGPAELSPQAAAALPKPGELHDPEVETICRRYLDLRYRLLPYIYSMAFATHRTGMPLMRALWLNHPQDAEARKVADAYMFGDSLLVAPVLEPAASKRRVYLPAGAWWDFWKGERIEGGAMVTREVDRATLPLLVKAGSILPLGPVKQYATEPAGGDMELRIYPGADGSFSLYEDDGVSFRFEQGEYTQTEFAWNDSGRSLRVRHAGGRVGGARSFTVSMAGGPARTVRFTGEALTIAL